MAAAAALSALGGGLVIALDRTPRLQRPDWRGLARILGPAAQARVVVVPGGYRAQPLRLYLHPSAYLIGGDASVGEVDVVTRAPRGIAAAGGARRATCPCSPPPSLPRARDSR